MHQRGGNWNDNRSCEHSGEFRIRSKINREQNLLNRVATTRWGYLGIKERESEKEKLWKKKLNCNIQITPRTGMRRRFVTRYGMKSCPIGLNWGLGSEIRHGLRFRDS